jgi:hypothetical protein
MRATVCLCNTRRVFRPRHILACTIILGLLAVLSPAASLASSCGGGGSAGNQQYIDPLCGTQHHKSSGSSGSGSGSGSGSSGATSTPQTTTPVPTTTTPTATTAATTSTTSPDPKGKPKKTLPFTGFNTLEAAGFGFVLIAGGLGLRRRTQRS